MIFYNPAEPSKFIESNYFLVDVYINVLDEIPNVNIIAKD